MSQLVVPVPLRTRPVVLQQAWLDAYWARSCAGLWHGGGSTAVVERLAFDSELFGFPMGRVNALSLGGAGVGIGVIGAARALGIRHLTVRIPSDSTSAVQDFTAAGFYLTDTTTTFSLRGWPSSGTPVVIDMANPSDIPSISELSAEVFDKSRFFNDPHLDKRVAKEVFSRWSANNCNGRADTCFVAREGAMVLGYNQCLFEGAEVTSGLPSHATIDLIAVSPKAQGRGLGRDLVAACLDHYFKKADEIYVGTQASNRAAIRLYESSGFKFESLDLCLHWFDQG